MYYMPSAIMYYTAIHPAIRPISHGLEPPKPWVKINFSLYKWMISGILLQERESD
jgi:hypothetical protein